MAASTTLPYAASLKEIKPYDIVVCGGGPSGIPAAIGAARAGMKVLLIEQTGQLGGVGTSAGVSHLLGGRLSDNSGWCVAGIFKEIVEGLAARGGAIHPETIKPETKECATPLAKPFRGPLITPGMPKQRPNVRRRVPLHRFRIA